MRRLASIAITVAGLLLIGQSTRLVSLPLSLLIAREQGAFRFHVATLFAVSVLPAVLTLALGVMLVIGRHRLATRWFDDGPLDMALDAVSLLRIALLVTGVALASQGLVGVASAMVSVVQFVAMGIPGGKTAALSNLRPELAGQLLSLVLGTAFVVGSRPLARRLWDGASRPEYTEAPAGEQCPHCGTAYDPADYRQGAAHRCTTCGGPLQAGV